jgi:hypothetical protein
MSISTVDASVVHQNIDASVARQGGVHQVPDIVRLRHVTLDADGAAALGLDRPGRVVNGACGISAERRAGR